MKRFTLLGMVLILLLSFVSVQAGEEGEKSDTPKVDKKYAKHAEKRVDIRKEDNKIVTLETNYGKMVCELYRDVAPAHADSFAARTADGFYGGTVFHRVVKGFMIQGGDPTGTGTGGPGYSIPAEFNSLKHVEGTLSMARSQSPNSAGSQFFVCLERNRSTEYLDGKYTVFGQVLKGFDTLHKIGDVKTKKQPRGNEMSAPVETIHLIKAYLSDAEGNPLEKAAEEAPKN